MSRHSKLMSNLTAKMNPSELVDFFDMCWWAKYKYGGYVIEDVKLYLAVGRIPEYVWDILDRIVQEQNRGT